MKRWGIMFLVLLGEIALFTTVSGQSFTEGNELLTYLRSYFADLVTQAVPVLLLAFGMALVLSTAGIDLSVASTVALISCVMSTFPAGDNFWWSAVPVGLLVGLAAGFLNGTLVARLDVPPIIATLGTMIFFRGLCFVIMGDKERSPFLDVPGFESFGNLGGALLLVLLVFVGLGAYLHRSTWLRELLMIGGNRVAARYAAVPVERRLLQVYTLMGGLAFLAALSFTSRNGSVSASSFTGMELPVIVAVVLGGTPVHGGSKTFIGTIFGVFLIAVLDEGLRGAAIWGERKLPFKLSHLEYIFLGGLLILGVLLNQWFGRAGRARNAGVG